MAGEERSEREQVPPSHFKLLSHITSIKSQKSCYREPIDSLTSGHSKPSVSAPHRAC